MSNDTDNFDNEPKKSKLKKLIKEKVSSDEVKEVKAKRKPRVKKQPQPVETIPLTREEQVKKTLNPFIGIIKGLNRTILNSLGITVKEARDAGFKVVLHRNVPGDRFYQHLTHKRVNGKWSVKR